ncbi:MAG: hypothetical protein PF448_03510 [Bacteroidales bacterium]|jgi:membrane protein implicated in regulation of membrane protease activity|nr:hypothetical protein [Bacteroidales bacterium]
MLIRLLFLFIIFVFIMFLLLRVVLPYKFRKISRKMQHAAEERDRENRQRGKKEGDVTIETPGKSKNKRDYSDAEFVDYEEIKDE